MTDRNVQHIDFGFTDRLGRRIGCMIITETMTEETTRVSTQNYVPEERRALEAGRPLFLYMKATRNEAGYGASQDRHYFATEAERQAKIDAYLKAARKRAEKKAGK